MFKTTSSLLLNSKPTLFVNFQTCGILMFTQVTSFKAIYQPTLPTMHVDRQQFGQIKRHIRKYISLETQLTLTVYQMRSRTMQLDHQQFKRFWCVMLVAANVSSNH